MNPVTLVDGRVVDSSSEAWRVECEARYLLTRMRLLARRAYLADIQKRRGDAAYNVLRDALIAVHAARAAKPETPE